MGRRSLNTISWLGIAITSASCAPIGPRPPAPIPDEYLEFAPNYPFVPARVDIHPATRFGRDAEGRAYIRVYLQFRDRWGDNVKTIGTVVMELFAEGGEPSVAWDLVNLSDDLTNHQHYDPVTGMYEMDLTSVPDWAAGAAPDAPRSAEAPIDNKSAEGGLWLRITATLPGPSGPRQLTDDYHLRP